MDSYQRFEAILNHKKPDKMPFYFPTIACSVASEILGRKVNMGGDSLHFNEEKSWLDGEAAHTEFIEKHHADCLELNKKLNSDIIRETWRQNSKPTKKIDDYTLLFGDEDGKHVIKRYFPDTQSYGIVEDTVSPQDVDSLEESLKKQLESNNTISEREFEKTLQSIYSDQLRLREMSKSYFPAIVSTPAYGFPMESVVWLEVTLLIPELLKEYFIYRASIILQHIKFHSKMGYKFITGGIDIGTTSGPMISPNSYREILLPGLRMIGEECRKLGVVYCYKTDGNIWDLCDMFFKDAGVTAYGEVERTATMTVGEIHKKYPDLILLGNINSTTLSGGSVDEVREETRATLEESHGVNYIPGPSNAIVHGTPAENVYAMIDEIEKYKP